MRLRHHAVIALVSVLLVVSARPAVAAAPMEELRTRVDRIIKALSDPSLRPRTEERRRAIREVASEVFDFESSAKRTLGPHWQTRTPEERQEFVRLYTELLERSYISKIEQYQGEPIKWIGEQVDGEEATVRTAIVTKQGAEVPVNYRMHQSNAGWRVYDVVIEGVSLVANYRTQFNKIIQTSSYKDLVARLKAKAEPGA